MHWVRKSKWGLLQKIEADKLSPAILWAADGTHVGIVALGKLFESLRTYCNKKKTITKSFAGANTFSRMAGLCIRVKLISAIAAMV